MNLKDTLKLAVSPEWWFIEKSIFPEKIETIKQPTPEELAQEAENFKRITQKMVENVKLDNYKLVKAIDLKAGDKIIHNYSKFLIQECGCGFGAGNEFGNYFWIKGNFINGNPTDPSPLKDFWSFQGCPMIVCIE